MNLVMAKLSVESQGLSIHHNVLPVPSKLSPQCPALSRIKFKAYFGCFLCQSPSLLMQVIKLGGK